MTMTVPQCVDAATGAGDRVAQVWYSDSMVVVIRARNPSKPDGLGPIVVSRLTGQVSFLSSGVHPDSVIEGMSLSSDPETSQEPQNGPPGPGQP